MTRLIEDWIKDIPQTISEAEKDLRAKTGHDFVSLAAAVGSTTRERIGAAALDTRIGVVPVTAGQGIIGSFSEVVAAIIRHMGFTAFVTESTDVAGIYEAHQKGADILFAADDERFLAINMRQNKISENSIATARGYVAALEGAVGCLAGKRVLVLGCGRVGKAALRELKARGADCAGYEWNEGEASRLASEGWAMIPDLGQMSRYPIIFDANTGDSWITAEMLHPQVWVAAPGVPLSLDASARATHQDRLIHDYLPIGVAAMLGEVV